MGIFRATAASSKVCDSSVSILGRDRLSIEPRRVVGSLAYFSTDIAEPGDPPHRGQSHQLRRTGRHAIGSDARAIAEALIAAGFRCPVTTRFRHEIWVKLLGNVAFNPISALTGGTLEELVRHATRRGWCARS